MSGTPPFGPGAVPYLKALQEHNFLSTPQLQLLVGNPALESVSRRLRELLEGGLAAKLSTTHGALWQLTARGRAACRYLRGEITRENVRGSKEGKWDQHTLRHDLYAAQFLTNFVRAGHPPDYGVLSLVGTRGAPERFHEQAQQYLRDHSEEARQYGLQQDAFDVRPDGFAVLYHSGPPRAAFVHLELDSGAQQKDVLAEKVRKYDRFLSYTSEHPQLHNIIFASLESTKRATHIVTVMEHMVDTLRKENSGLSVEHLPSFWAVGYEDWGTPEALSSATLLGPGGKRVTLADLPAQKVQTRSKKEFVGAATPLYHEPKIRRHTALVRI